VDLGRPVDVTALLLVLFLGYMRCVGSPPSPRFGRSAARRRPFAFVDVRSCTSRWSVADPASGGDVLNANLSPTIHGSMAWTLLLGFVAITLAFIWMVAVRYRIEVLRDEIGEEELEVSLAERRAESGTVEAGFASAEATPTMALQPRPELPAIPGPRWSHEYVDAGYIIAFSVLFLYVVSLLVRRRRLSAPSPTWPHGATPSAERLPGRHAVTRSKTTRPTPRRHQSAGADRGTVCA